MDAPSPAAIARRRWLIAIAAGGGLLAVALLVIAFMASRDHRDIPHRGNALADLLAWIPADDPAAQSFVVWTPDPGKASETTALDALPTYSQLGFDPIPTALGTDLDWTERYGWSAGEVTGWVAGANGEIGVFRGEFVLDEIGSRLKAAGYQRGSYRGIPLYSGEQTGTPAGASSNLIPGVGAIALLSDRIVTATTPERLRHAIDVAKAGRGSLADNGAIASALRTLAPLSALTGIAQAALAADCDQNAIGQSTAEAGLTNYAFVGYGRLGSGGARRTMIAVSFPDDSTAAADLPAFTDGWANGYVNARGTGSSIATFGQVSDVGQTGRLLVAELVNGRDDGWVTAGIRYALPVCEAALALAPAATPDLTGGRGREPTMERLSNALPSTGDTGERFRAVDLRAAATARGVLAPNGSADVAAWLSALQPLPAMDVLPSDGTAAAWSADFGIPWSAVDGVAELNETSGAAAVGMVIGNWDEAGLTARLTSLGYETIVIGSTRQFAIGRGVAARDPFLATHPVWTNIAILGDRMWVSSDQATMRDVLAQATDPAVESVQSSTLLRPRLGSSFAIQSEGATALVARCGSALQGTVGLAVALEASGDATTVDVVAVLDGAQKATTVSAALDRRLGDLTLPAPVASPVASPVAITGRRVVDAFRYLGVAPGSEGAQPNVEARLTIAPNQLGRATGLFATLLDGCQLTGAT